MSPIRPAVWDNVYGFNMSCIREVAMMEPLVDTVEGDQVVSAPCEIKDVNIDVSSVEEVANFTSAFELTMDRNDYVHALVAYFDVEFSRCHKPTGFSTSPHERGTHWKQTVFYLEDELVVCAGEKLTGTLECKQNAKNPRDLDITISYKFDGKKSQAERTQRYMMR